jgi:hypothetical protein
MIYPEVARLIGQIECPRLLYDPDKNKTLLFIDTRYQDWYYDLFRLFISSVGFEWNMTVVCPPEHTPSYKKIEDRLGCVFRFIRLDANLNSTREYNRFMTDPEIYRHIPEETIFVFQSDSQAFRRFDPRYLEYNYVGAIWPNPVMGQWFGNGGTCLRKTRIVQRLLEEKPYTKYIAKQLFEFFSIKGIRSSFENEDVFISKSMNNAGLMNCSYEDAKKFSSELVFDPESLYGHQLHNILGEERLKKHWLQTLTEWIAKEKSFSLNPNEVFKI